MYHVCVTWCPGSKHFVWQASRRTEVHVNVSLQRYVCVGVGQHPLATVEAGVSNLMILALQPDGQSL